MLTKSVQRFSRAKSFYEDSLKCSLPIPTIAMGSGNVLPLIGVSSTLILIATPEFIIKREETTEIPTVPIVLLENFSFRCSLNAPN